VGNLGLTLPASRFGDVILSDRTLRELIESGRIVLEPFDPELVQPASVDVRLGNEFRVMRNSRLTHIDPFEPQQKLMDTVTVPNGEPFVLHPGEFALGHTAEIIGCPDDIVGIVNGKSSLGRLGIQVHATAGFIDPGFRGTVVLELSNVANLPILLRPGMKIAQMVFQRLDRPAERPYGHPDLKSKYQGQQGAVASKYDENTL
jgi:dCTP deaminase